MSGTEFVAVAAWGGDFAAAADRLEASIDFGVPEASDACAGFGAAAGNGALVVLPLLGVTMLGAAFVPEAGGACAGFGAEAGNGALAALPLLGVTKLGAAFGAESEIAPGVDGADTGAANGAAEAMESNGTTL